MTENTHHPRQPSKAFSRSSISFNHFIKNLIARSLIMLQNIDVLLENRLKAFFNAEARQAAHWARSFSNIFFMSILCMLIIWVPRSESESITLIVINNLLSNHVNERIWNDLPFNSNVTNFCLLKRIRGVSVFFRIQKPCNHR